MLDNTYKWRDMADTILNLSIGKNMKQLILVYLVVLQFKMVNNYVTKNMEIGVSIAQYEFQGYHNRNDEALL